MDELQSPGSAPCDNDVFYTNSGLPKGRDKEKEREKESVQKSRHRGGDQEVEHWTDEPQRQGRNG